MRIAAWCIGRKLLCLSGILRTASQPIAKARRESSASSHEYLESLGRLFQAGYEERTIWLHRTVVSFYYERIQIVNIDLN